MWLGSVGPAGWRLIGTWPGRLLRPFDPCRCLGEYPGDSGRTLKVRLGTTTIQEPATMASELPEPKASTDENVLQAQYLRALSSFEGIMLAQIEMKTQLSNRLNWTIRAGLILLGGIAVSILVLLLTLSSQINRMSDMVVAMNAHFESVTARMDEVTLAMGSMKEQVALMQQVGEATAQMDEEMAAMKDYMQRMREDVAGVQSELSVVKDEMAGIAATVHGMNGEVAVMGHEMHRLAKPARTLNRMFPFP